MSLHIEGRSQQKRCSRGMGEGNVEIIEGVRSLRFGRGREGGVEGHTFCKPIQIIAPSKAN